MRYSGEHDRQGRYGGGYQRQGHQTMPPQFQQQHQQPPPDWYPESAPAAYHDAPFASWHPDSAPAGYPGDAPPASWHPDSAPPVYHGDRPAPSWWDQYPEYTQEPEQVPPMYPEAAPGWGNGEDRYPQGGGGGGRDYGGGGQVPPQYDDWAPQGYSDDRHWYPEDGPPPGGGGPSRRPLGSRGPPTMPPPRYGEELPLQGAYPDEQWASPHSPSHGSQISASRPGGASGSRRRAKTAPRPPASEHHQSVPKRSQQVSVGGREHPGEASFDPRDMEPHQVSVGGREHPGGASFDPRDMEIGQPDALGGGDDDDDDHGGRSHVDPALTLQRLGKIRQAQTQKTLSAWATRQDYEEPPHINDLPRPPAAARWQVGASRAKLRHQFNRKELDVAKIIRNYDDNHDWTLELPEFRHLLQDYNSWFHHISAEELYMVMILADKDHDECISPTEVLFALRVWFAYVSMPRAAGPVIASLSDASMPTAETIREALLVLNEECPVSLEEADYVQHVALAIGGTEERVSTKQMRMAVSTWYLHVERKQTTGKELAKHAVAGAHARLGKYNPIQQLFRCECDAMVCILMGMFVVIWAVLPSIAIWIGSYADTGAICQGVGFLVTTAAFECTVQKAVRIGSIACTGLVTLYLLLCWILGMWQVSNSTPSMCGFFIWEFGNLIWVVVPGFVLIFLCCCLPCLYLFEYCNHRKMDQQMMGLHQEGGDEDDSEAFE